GDRRQRARKVNDAVGAPRGAAGRGGHISDVVDRRQRALFFDTDDVGIAAFCTDGAGDAVRVRRGGGRIDIAAVIEQRQHAVVANAEGGRGGVDGADVDVAA